MVFDYINMLNKDGKKVTMYVLEKDLPIPSGTLTNIVNDLRDRNLVDVHLGTKADRWGIYNRGIAPNVFTISKRGKALLARKRMELQVNDLIMGDQVKVSPECLSMMSSSTKVVATVTRRLKDTVIIKYAGVRYEVSPECLKMARKYHS
jgi:hypothetical protein